MLCIFLAKVWFLILFSSKILASLEGKFEILIAEFSGLAFITF